ncbi:hypothetical protein [Rhizobium grahamii]|uniref:Uncharacterized protein n=1 Tax=Rhizobium grahamii CCGE 502 TaxID=990285 RepID=S3IBZ2_9HYPH|nr:hypothetical protein [Rhizobium grahamii]EPE96738.1 hypothetical protein RGCCGE502_18950 [Rhizobium grahamii CCGE 502]
MTKEPQRHVGAIKGGGAYARGITGAVIDGISQAGDSVGPGTAPGRRIRIDALTVRIGSDTGMPHLTDVIRREIARALRRMT